MEPYDLEIGPTQRAFEGLFKSINAYFDTARVVPNGSVRETHLSDYSQDQLHKALSDSLTYYGFTDLPLSLRVEVKSNSNVSGIQRSDKISTFDEKMSDGSLRTFNFYRKFGPENMKASYYWLDMEREGEQTQGILMEDDRWYLRIITSQDSIYYLRVERSNPQW
jgi:hypothetical protein